MNKEKEIYSNVYVPKAWFGLRPVTDIAVTLSLIQRDAYKTELLDVLDSYNTDQRKYKYEITIRPDKQYIRFEFHGYYVEPVKEMTIEQIEQELGYKINIVADKASYDVYCPNRVCGCCTICDNRKCDHPVPNCKGFAYEPLSRS